MTNKRIWDLPVRLTHWGLVISFFGAFFTAEGPAAITSLHIPFAFMLFTLVVFRIFWGLFGSETARFSHFVRGYGAIKAYAEELKELRHKEYWGHNPLGALAVVAILLGNLAIISAGLFASSRGFSGPWSGAVSTGTSALLTGTHEIFANIVMTVVVVHIVAIFGYKIVLKDNLITPMIKGTRPADESQPEPRFTSSIIALFLLAVAVSISSYAFGYWGLM